MTYGVHSFGDGEVEKPADDPSKYITPDFLYDEMELQTILDKYNSSIEEFKFKLDDYGTYHFRNLLSQVFLTVKCPHKNKKDLEYDLETIQKDELQMELTGSKYGSEYVEAYGQFISFEDTLKKWKEFVKSKNPVIPTGSSENYWNKKILGASMGYKKYYDGD